VAVAAGSPIGEERGTQAELGELVARPEVAVHGELHVEDEAAGVVGHTVELAGGFTCGHRHDVMAELPVLMDDDNNGGWHGWQRSMWQCAEWSTGESRAGASARGGASELGFDAIAHT
jgi:hypothetical protein